MNQLERLLHTATWLPEQEDASPAGAGEHRQGIAELGFRPAFLDTATLSIYLSCHADGRLASFHLLDGLPDEVVLARWTSGHVISAKATLVPGFERNGFFYTRSAADRAAAEWTLRD